MPLSADDRFEIHELYARYCHCFDSGEADRYAGLFTPDGTFVRQGTPDAGVQPMEVRGTANLAAFVRQRHNELKESKTGIRHWVSNVSLDATPGGATGTAYVAVFTLGVGEPPKMARLGRYRDELTKGVDGWRFRSRTFQPDF